MKCNKCKKEVNYVKYLLQNPYCWKCVLKILADSGIYLGKGKFLVKKFIIKYAKAGGN